MKKTREDIKKDYVDRLEAVRTQAPRSTEIVEEVLDDLGLVWGDMGSKNGMTCPVTLVQIVQEGDAVAFPDGGGKQLLHWVLGAECNVWTRGENAIVDYKKSNYEFLLALADWLIQAHVRNSFPLTEAGYQFLLDKLDKYDSCKELEAYGKKRPGRKNGSNGIDDMFAALSVELWRPKPRQLKKRAEAADLKQERTNGRSRGDVGDRVLLDQFDW